MENVMLCLGALSITPTWFQAFVGCVLAILAVKAVKWIFIGLGKMFKTLFIVSNDAGKKVIDSVMEDNE